MKTLKTIIIAVASALAVTTASAASYVIGLSPNFNKPDRELILKSILLFVLESASIGDDIVVYDALNLQPVSTLSLPKESLLERNARARAHRLAADIGTLQKFFATERVFPPELSNAIHAPQFLSLTATQLRKGNEPMRIILIGLPFYVSVEEPSFNMNDAFPSDAHIVAEGRDSVFGTAQKKNAMAGITVHYSYLRECFLNDYHRERTGRFWSLFIGEQRGSLATFASDLGLAFQRARQDVKEPCISAQLDPKDSKLEMCSVKPRSVPNWLSTTNAAAEQPAIVTTIPLVVTNEASAAPIVTNEPPIANEVVAIPSTETNEVEVATIEPPVATAPVAPEAVQVVPQEEATPKSGSQKVKIGIAWSVPVDLDLYVKPRPESKEISFKKRITAEGRHYHENRVETKGSDFEYVELDGEFDLPEIRAWVNLYSGRAKSVQGMVVVVYRDKTYRQPFSIKGTVGNMGFNASSRDKSQNWVELNLNAITENKNLSARK